MRNIESERNRRLNIYIRNPIILSYLQTPEHYELWEIFTEKPTKENRKKLDKSFKEFFLKIKFTSYLSKTIYFNAINFDKKMNLQTMRNQLILDKPLSEDDSLTLADTIPANEDNVKVNSSKIEDHISDYLLYTALQELTENQRLLLSLAYVFEYSDSEIADMLGRSQQAVSKSHKNALKKLKNILESRKEASE